MTPSRSDRPSRRSPGYRSTAALRRLVWTAIARAGLLFASQAAASQPQPPKGVPATASYHAKGKVWFVENGGVQTVWYANGVKKAEGKFRSRLRQGQWSFWFPSGKLKAVGAFKDSKREGTWKLYSKKGTLRSTGNYIQNRREGQWQFFMTNGKTEESEGLYKGGLKNGEWKSYYDNGKVFYSGQYQNDLAHGNWQYFYKNGKPYQKGQFRKDVRVGEWIICIQPGGPCGKEQLRSGRTPRTTRIDLNTIQGGSRPGFTGRVNDTSDPKALLESLDTGGVPDRVPEGIPGPGWAN